MSCLVCGGSGTVTNPGASERQFLEGLAEEPCPACWQVPADRAADVADIAEAVVVMFWGAQTGEEGPQNQ